jgi:coenzyme F420-0:L-glutamate ligase/coenzyme F420-1:gamma-L-glutamate ligase
MSASLQGYIIQGLPVIREGDDLTSLIESLFEIQDGDVLCIASTIVAKSEGRFRDLDDYRPGPRAVGIAQDLGKDARFVQAVLDESDEILLERPFLLAVTRFGHVGVNAGIDQSNVGSPDDPPRALLLPVDPDGSAAILRKRLSQSFGVPVAVIISDSFGRAWRRGTCGVAIGAAGLPSLMDLRGAPDLFGRELQVSVTGHADEIAAAASLVMGQGAEGQPVVIVRGLTWRGPDNAASELVRPAAEDMFR